MTKVENSNEQVNVSSSKEKAPNKQNHRRETIITIIASIFVVICLSISGLLIFHNTYYTSFWVSGQSMYPTLNYNARNPDGELVGNQSVTGNINGYSGIDYGIMDEHQNAIDNIERNDIVVLHYSNFDKTEKIKRVIVLPGETFYITSTTPGQEDNGNLYVLNVETNEFELTFQNLSEEIIHGGTYPTSYSTPHTLDDNEIFVIGDNRYAGRSNDSRNEGPILCDYISGVVVALEATVTVHYSNGEYTLTNFNFFWPRFI